MCSKLKWISETLGASDWEKRKKNIEQLKNPDPEGLYYGLMTIVFPSKALLELKRKKYQEEK